MASEIRVNSLSSRTGLSTVTFTDTGPIFSGITTFQDNSGFNVGTGGSIFSPASNTVTLGTNSAERFRITSSGNIGIGTDNPGARTHIDSVTSNTPLVVEASENNRSRIVFRNNVETGTECNIELFDDDLRFVTNSAERLRIDSSGNLLLKTGEIDIQGGNKTVKTSAGFLQLGTSGSHHTAIITAGSERLRITSAGNLGIGGLTSPGALLSIPAGESNTPRLAIESAVDDNDFTITQYEDGNGTYTMLGQNVKLNSSGNNTILDSGHRTAGILLDARNHGSITFLTGAANAVGENVKITSAGNISVGGATGGDFSLLDGIVTNTANGSAGLLINSSSSSHNAYLGFSYGSGSSTSHADQFSAYIGRVGDNTLILGTNNNIRARVTSGGDVLIGGQSAYTYDDTGASNTILDIWNSGNNKRGILSLSGNTNAGASIGTIWFNNENNSGASPGNTMKLSAAIQAQAVTTDSNAGNDAGARLQFLTKPEGSPMTDSMIISGEGYVTKPRQPSFRAGRNSNYTPGAGADIIFNVDSGGGKHNVGNHYNTSNGRFTAPVAGVYTFTIHVIWMNLSSGQNMADCFHPKINGVVQGYSGRRGEYIANETGNNGYYTDFMTYQFTLAASDYVTVNNQFNLTIHGNSNYTTFSGHLVC